MTGPSSYVFESPRLGFRHWLPADRPIFAAMNADPEVMEYFPKPLTLTESDAFVDRIIEQLQTKPYGLWAVELKVTRAFIGYIGFAVPRFTSYFTPCIEIGWRLAKQYWGQGYATEGAAFCLDRGFALLGFSEFFSFTSKLNIRSERVMIKLGMQKLANFQHPGIPESHDLCEHVLYNSKHT